MMIEKYLNKLEYNKILDLVSNYCSTYIGKDFVSKLMPLNNKRFQLNEAWRNQYGSDFAL